MPETLRIEQVMDNLVQILEKSTTALSIPELEARMSRKMDDLQTGDVRSAVWSLYDKSIIRFTRDRKLQRTRKPWQPRTQAAATA